MLDCQLFGLDPGAHHLTNVLFHAGTACALFLVLLRMTDALWRWKLSLPSASHASDVFWQQLFLALVGPGSTMHFGTQPYFAALQIGDENSGFTAGGPLLRPTRAPR